MRALLPDAEILGPIEEVRAARGPIVVQHVRLIAVVGVVADADLAQLTIQDIGAMPGAAHPAGDDIAGRRIARGDVLGRPTIWVAGPLEPSGQREAIRAGVAKEIIGRHILAVASRGSAKLRRDR